MGKARRYYANEREVMKDCLNTKLTVEDTERLFVVLKKRFRFSHKLNLINAEFFAGNCSGSTIKLNRNKLNLLYLIHECAHAVQWINRHKTHTRHRRLERLGVEVFITGKNKRWHSKGHMKIMERMKAFLFEARCIEKVKDVYENEHIYIRRD